MSLGKDMSPDHRRGMGSDALRYQQAVLDGDPATHCDDSTGPVRDKMFGVKGFGEQFSERPKPKQIYNPITDEWETV